MDPSYRSIARRAAMTPVNTGLIIINVLVFLYMLIFGDINNNQYMYAHGANFWPDVFYNHEYYRLLSCAFIHFSLQHIFNNMLVLAFVGDNLERALGKFRYLLLYLATAVCASLASDAWFMLKGSYGISGGASGAVFGVVGALLVIVIRNKGRLEDLSSRQLMLFAGFSIYHGVTSAGIDNMAHVGGFLTGALLGLLMYRKKRSSY